MMDDGGWWIEAGASCEALSQEPSRSSRSPAAVSNYRQGLGARDHTLRIHRRA